MALQGHNQPMRHICEQTYPEYSYEDIRSPGPNYEDISHLLAETDHQTEHSRPKSRSSPKPSRWEAVLRSYELSILYAKIQNHDEEYPKVVIWESRSVALSKLLLHFLPFNAVVVLVFFNLYGYWLGTEVPGYQGYNSAKLGALQFAAKAHEITMLASLSMIVFTLVQDRIVSGNIAFGAFFAGLQYSNVSYLWSKELWALIGCEWRRPHGKRFVLTLLLATCLAPTVGPSSSVLMVPKIDDWPAGGTDFWLNTTPDKLWPEAVTDRGVDPGCLFDKDQFDCPSSGWKGFDTGAFPMFHNLALPGTPYFEAECPGSILILGRYGYRTMDLLTPFNYAMTVATGLTTVLADSLAVAAMSWHHATQCSPERQHFNWRTRADWNVAGLRQPMTNTACNHWDLAERDGGGISFPILDHLPVPDAIPRYESVNISDLKLVAEAFESVNSPHPQVRWMPLAKPGLGNHSIGAIVTLPSSPGSDGHILSCTVDAYWGDADYQISLRKSCDSTWAAEVKFNQTTGDHGERFLSLPRIRLSPEWAKYLNPQISSTNQTVIDSLYKAAGIWPIDKDTIGRIREVTELGLAMMVSNGLSNLNSQAELQGRRAGTPSRKSWRWRCIPDERSPCAIPDRGSRTALFSARWCKSAMLGSAWS